jgi:hypothetical protein
MTTDHRLLAKSVVNRIDIPRDRLIAPGAPGVITVLALMENETREDANRLRDRSLRVFEMELLLTKQMTLPDVFNCNFTREDGASFIKASLADQKLRVRTSGGVFDVELNSRHELALIRMSVEATAPEDARNRMYDATAPFLDHLSYLARASILTGQLKVWDSKNQAQMIYMTGPDREVFVNLGTAQLFNELAPVYALYREFKNSSSAYYRLLCLYKIMEGIFSLRGKAHLKAKEIGATLPSIPKERVPDDPDISTGLRQYVGKSIRGFYDNVLQKNYRDVVSHFLVQEDVILKVSSAEDNNRFAEMAFVCDLCVRLMISNHESFLRAIPANFPSRT